MQADRWATADARISPFDGLAFGSAIFGRLPNIGFPEVTWLNERSVRAVIFALQVVPTARQAVAKLIGTTWRSACLPALCVRMTISLGCVQF